MNKKSQSIKALEKENKRLREILDAIGLFCYDCLYRFPMVGEGEQCECCRLHSEVMKLKSRCPEVIIDDEALSA